MTSRYPPSLYPWQLGVCYAAVRVVEGVAVKAARVDAVVDVSGISIQ